MSDTKGYFMALGQKRTAEQKRDAAVGRAVSERDREIKVAVAVEAQKKAECLDKEKIALSQRDYEISFQKNLAEKRERSVEANLAYELQEYKSRQKIVELEMDKKLVEKKKQLEVLKQETDRIERTLDATVKQPAIASKYEKLQEAEAAQTEVLLAAEAEAEAIRVQGEADAHAARVKGEAQADRLRRAAEAYQKYDKNAMVDLYLKQLPRIAAEVAAPLQNVDKVTMVATGDGEVGASRMLGEVTSMVDQVVASVANGTGINLQDTIKGMK